MTTANNNLIPNGVDTIEKRLVYDAMILQTLYPLVKNQETEKRDDYAIDLDIHKAEFEENPTDYLIVVRAVIPFDNNWMMNGALYNSVYPLGNLGIPNQLLP